MKYLCGVGIAIDCNSCIIESLIRPFVIDSYYSEILKSCHALVIVHLEIGIV